MGARRVPTITRANCQKCNVKLPCGNTRVYKPIYNVCRLRQHHSISRVTPLNQWGDFAQSVGRHHLGRHYTGTSSLAPFLCTGPIGDIAIALPLALTIQSFLQTCTCIHVNQNKLTCIINRGKLKYARLVIVSPENRHKTVSNVTSRDRVPTCAKCLLFEFEP